MAYTPDQQKRIDDANAKVASAQKAYDNSVSIKDGYYAEMKRLHDNSNLSGECYKDRKTLDDQIAWGTLNEENCRSKGKCDRSDCRIFVTAFNTNHGLYKTAVIDVSNKLSALSSAKQELKNLLDNIGEEVQNDPDFINTQTQIQAQADADAKARSLKIWFWIITALTAGGLIFAWMRWGRKAMTAS